MLKQLIFIVTFITIPILVVAPGDDLPPKCRKFVFKNYTNLCPRTVYPFQLKLKYQDMMVNVMSVYRVLKDDKNPNRYLIIFSNVIDPTRIYNDTVEYVYFKGDGITIERGFTDEEERKEFCRLHAIKKLNIQKVTMKIYPEWKPGDVPYYSDIMKQYEKDHPLIPGSVYVPTSLGGIDFERAFKELKDDHTQFPQNATTTIEWYRTAIHCLDDNLEYFKELINFCGGDAADMTGGMIYYFEPLFPNVIINSVSKKLTNYSLTLFVVILNVLFKQLF